MCGICGIINLNSQSVHQEPILKMMQIQKHRGPDDDGVFIENTVGFGFVRLSIIDLSSAGHQPMLSSNKRYVVVFNGEIYNYIELREELKILGYVFNTNTDTEVLLTAYTEWGEDCLNHFNGMWAFAIYDRTKKTVFASRDRFGVKPFYYLLTKEFFAFASEIPPLLSLLQTKPTPDYQSIFDYLAFNRTDQTENTFFNEIKKLQHGCKLTIGDIDYSTDCNMKALNPNSQSLVSNPKLRIEKWYDLRERVSRVNGFNDAWEFRELFSSSVGLRLRSDVPVGVCLSGGLDSSSIASIIAKDYSENKLNTFSVIFGKEIKTDESEYIEKLRPIAAKMNFFKPTAVDLYKDIPDFIKTIGEPVPSTGPYAQYKVLELSQGKVVVLLNGQGADELLAGYHYFFGFFFKDLLKSIKLYKLSVETFCYLVKHKSFFGIKSFLYFMLTERIRTHLSVGERGYLNIDFVKQFQNNNSISENLYGSTSLKDALLDHFEYKLEHLLKWEDRNSMRFSLESRLPFLDYRLVEKSLASKNRWIINYGNTKYILRKAMSGIVPQEIIDRNDKIGFGAPQDNWFRESLFREFILELVQSDSFRKRVLFDINKIQKLIRNHFNNLGNYGNDIWKAINLELWFRYYID